MDELIRDLVVMGLIGILCFVGAVEYVYWRFGLDRITEHLRGIEEAEWLRINDAVMAARKAKANSAA